MMHKPSQLISMQFIGLLYGNINHVYHLIFFIIGISLGIVASLCFSSLSFSLQVFLYPLTTPITTLLPSSPLPLPSSKPIYATPPPPAPLKMINSSSSQNTKSNSTSIPLKTCPLHNMTDQELFLKASMVSRIQEFPNKSVPKMAFMFLEKGALPFAPLWEKFFKDHAGFYSIYLHQHPSFNETMPQDFVFYGRKVPSQPVFWGMNSSLSFLGSFDDPRKTGRRRYNTKMCPIINKTNWRKGSQWFEVHCELAIHIVSDTKYYPIFQQYCHPPCYDNVMIIKDQGYVNKHHIIMEICNQY